MGGPTRARSGESFNAFEHLVRAGSNLAEHPSTETGLSTSNGGQKSTFTMGGLTGHHSEGYQQQKQRRNFLRTRNEDLLAEFPNRPTKVWNASEISFFDPRLEGSRAVVSSGKHVVYRDVYAVKG